MGILEPETCWGNKTACFVASGWFFIVSSPCLRCMVTWTSILPTAVHIHKNSFPYVDGNRVTKPVQAISLLSSQAAGVTTPTALNMGSNRISASDYNWSAVAQLVAWHRKILPLSVYHSIAITLGRLVLRLQTTSDLLLDAVVACFSTSINHDLRKVVWNANSVTPKKSELANLLFVNNLDIAATSSITVLQLSVQSFGLLNQFLPSSSILDKGFPIWQF
jgi:hypothetical protein